MNWIKSTSQLRLGSGGLTLIGLLLAIFGLVRSGSIIFAIGSAALTFLRYQDGQKRRKIELFLPLAFAGVLLIVAITLPHGR